MNDTIFRIAILGMMVLAVSVSAYFRDRARRSSNDKMDRAQEGVPLMFVLRITGLGVWLTTLAYVINPEWIQFAALPVPDAARWLGLLLSAMALPLLVWMFRSLGNNITDTVQTRQTAQLVVRGPYRWVRHPLYSFGGLFFIGIILMSANGLIALFGVLAFTMLLMRTPKEEAQLLARFGDAYRDYALRTGRFFPRLTP